MLQTELHAHTSADPEDYIPHSSTQLIDRAAELGYAALAITLHDRWLPLGDARDYARDRGITLIAGIERTIERKHVLLLNFGPKAQDVDSFDSLAALKKSQPAGLVVAPHPFYPTRSCLGRAILDRHAALFDAVEINAYYTYHFNHFNEAAIAWARTSRKPMVGNGDIHRLRQLGRTFSLVDAAPDADAICTAIRTGRVEVRSTPLTAWQAATYLTDLVVAQLFKSSRS